MPPQQDLGPEIDDIGASTRAYIRSNHMVLFGTVTAICLIFAFVAGFFCYLILTQLHHSTLRQVQSDLLRQSLDLSELVERTLQATDLMLISVTERAGALASVEDKTTARVLNRGAQGAAVLQAQILLDRAWFSPGEISGNFDENMRKAVKAVLDVEPGNIDLAIDVVTELTKRGQKKEADELFTRVHAVHDAVCKEYPKSGWSHNNTAWLQVRCKRDLDAALEHARKGVDLEPDNAGHLDTLAEVHFQRGDKAKAVELMKKCIEMQPKYVYFRKQLKRMQAGDRDADLPAEPGPGTSLRSFIGVQ